MNWKILLVIAFSQLLVYGSFAQEKAKKITVSGVVTDSLYQPVSNAMIFVDGIKTNAVTNADGMYKIKVNPGAKKLMAFTFFHGAQEIDFTGETTVNFVLSSSVADPKSGTREEAEMVDVGYTKDKKEKLTTSVGNVDEEKIRYTNYRTIYDLIQGEIPGVVVRGNSVMIRGPSTVQGSTEPLFVVDGAVSDNISEIDPRQVKSISVLKGASASIYGVKGANGVILITLKSGKNTEK